jgi:hypothetical protein
MPAVSHEATQDDEAASKIEGIPVVPRRPASNALFQADHPSDIDGTADRPVAERHSISELPSRLNNVAPAEIDRIVAHALGTRDERGNFVGFPEHAESLHRPLPTTSNRSLRLNGPSIEAVVAPQPPGRGPDRAARVVYCQGSQACRSPSTCAAFVRAVS